MRLLLALLLLCGLLSGLGCTSVRVQPVDRNLQPRHICIEHNPRVKVLDLEAVVQDTLQHQGVSSEIVEADAPARCEYILRYTALRSWDIAPYLSQAELSLWHYGRRIAHAEYHLKGKGGLSLLKWQDTRTKLEPVIIEMLGRQ